MPTNIETDAALLERLRASAKKAMSKDELRKQRVSFVYGGLPSKSPITRAQVESAIARLEGENA